MRINASFAFFVREKDTIAIATFGRRKLFSITKIDIASYREVKFLF